MSQKATARKYRATIILDTRGYDQPVDVLIEKLSGIFTGLGASIETKENLGRRDFARTTDRNHTGDTYVEYALSAKPEVPAAFREKVRLDKTVKRVLIESI
ncbi:MAG: 30S ribosomal protein S6 [Verrucomicrobia bacterium]|nr:30S ribosomal protein S6 [Verrucomicrobiota bacterium]